jgi:hypothetical protein
MKNIAELKPKGLWFESRMRQGRKKVCAFILQVLKKTSSEKNTFVLIGPELGFRQVTTCDTRPSKIQQLKQYVPLLSPTRP